MELGDFGGAGGLDSFLLGFLRVRGGKRLKAKAIDRVVSPFGLHSGLRQSGITFDDLFIRRAEALRFRPECIGLWLMG